MLIIAIPMKLIYNNAKAIYTLSTPAGPAHRQLPRLFILVTSSVTVASDEVLSVLSLNRNDSIAVAASRAASWSKEDKKKHNMYILPPNVSQLNDLRLCRIA